MKRHLCIHGHFYQPPRENPWLEEVEREPSAHPYHDWNERVTAECYAANAAARILDGSGRIDRLVNNYEHISFNFGPTLLGWLERQRPAVYAAILEADRRGRDRCGGHGPALAQPYNHMILPLANRRDKETQIVWGRRDFARRFGRPAAGLWLPETAVDTETLELAAAHGAGFTILEPHQAKRVRELPPAAGLPPGPWRDAAGGNIDTTVPYRVALPSGRSLAVFFFNAPVARAVAFEGLLANGDGFAARLLAAFPREGGGDRLVSIATDGETYGHHHRFGDMALAYALRRIEAGGLARLTNYAEYLAAHAPAFEVELVEGSSWSCIHGVDRWREDCGCSTGGDPRWNQAWRAPLRAALDSLRDALAPRFADAAGELLADPWAARTDYIEVVLDRSARSVERFLARHARGGPPAGAARTRLLELLEMQRYAMLMYTSCGWFFNDLAGIETVQVLRYAARAAQLAGEVFGDGAFEDDLLRRLEHARSNDPDRGSGREIYLKNLDPRS